MGDSSTLVMLHQVCGTMTPQMTSRCQMVPASL